jgi:DNA-binding CsgD family transcriptional regulator
VARPIPSEKNMILAQIINIIHGHGPISAADIGDQIGRSREYVDVYIRQARKLNLAHVDILASRDLRHSVKLFVFGPGEDSIERTHIEPMPVLNKPVQETYVPRHDPAMLAFFGRAA